ncbi:hypothetical protein [Kribbella sp. NPDC051770]|uniref:hypothetical protein n=1 Tax=Kribbella sp. NPDC051770 TaxID=3155413 RepID=UPI00343FF52A
MSLFSEEEQAAPRRTPLRSKRVRRTAACIALPIGLYAALAVAGLLPLPGGGDPDAANPVAGLPVVNPADQRYPYVDGDPRGPVVTPTLAPSTEPWGVGRGDVQREDPSGAHAGRPTPGAPTTVPAEDPNRRPLPTITARPPVVPTPTSRPTPGTPSATPSPTPTPTETPSNPPDGDPEQDPTLADRLFGWLDELVP